MTGTCLGAVVTGSPYSEIDVVQHIARNDKSYSCQPEVRMRQSLLGRYALLRVVCQKPGKQVQPGIGHMREPVPQSWMPDGVMLVRKVPMALGVFAPTVDSQCSMS